MADAIRVERDPRFPEWYTVFRGDVELGTFGRTEEMGMIEWVAYTPDHRLMGTFHGRGCRARAQAAVIEGTTEVERLFAR